MAKKKKEHMVFDNMFAQKKGIPFDKMNKAGKGGQAKTSAGAPQKTFSRRIP